MRWLGVWQLLRECTREGTGAPIGYCPACGEPGGALACLDLAGCRLLLARVQTWRRQDKGISGSSGGSTTFIPTTRFNALMGHARPCSPRPPSPASPRTTHGSRGSTAGTVGVGVSLWGPVDSRREASSNTSCRSGPLASQAACPPRFPPRAPHDLTRHHTPD